MALFCLFRNSAGMITYGVDKLFVFDAEGLFPYTSAPHTDILVNLFKEEKPQMPIRMKYYIKE